MIPLLLVGLPVLGCLIVCAIWLKRTRDEKKPTSSPPTIQGGGGPGEE